MLISLAIVSIRDTVSARKRGEHVTLAQSFRSNFKKMKMKLKQNFQKQVAWLKKISVKLWAALELLFSVKIVTPYHSELTKPEDLPLFPK